MNQFVGSEQLSRVQLSRDELLAMASIAEEVGRPQDASTFMRLAIKKDVEAQLGKEERKLLYKVYKDRVTELRKSLRKIQSNGSSNIQNSAGNQGAAGSGVVVVGDLVKVVIQELVKIAEEVLELVEILDNFCEDSEAKVFYNKIAGDFNRYIAEVPASAWEISGFGKNSEILTGAIEKAQGFYSKAFAEAQTHLAPTHPVRLGLELNFSVFYCEILMDKRKAYEFAKESYEDAIAELDEEDFGKNDEANTTLSIIRDNIELWSRDLEQVEPTNASKP